MRNVPLSALSIGLLLFVTQSVRADDDARAILDKAAKAHGGLDKLTKEKAAQTKTKGTLDVGGGISFTEESFVQKDRFKSVSQLEVGNQNIQVTTVFNGEKAWVHAQDKTTELEGKLLDEIKEMANMMEISSYAFLKDKSVEVSSLGERKVNDRPALGVKLAKKGHRDIDLFFDKETGLLAMLARQMVDPMTEKDLTEERIITEYQEVDGIKVAKKAVVNRDGKKYIEVEVLEVKFRDKFDESEFAKP
jgi:hypothetical protein